jgi:hypothetical protein
MASGTADLQRDLGGALMQSIFGAVLTAGYAAEMTRLVGSSPQAATITDTTRTELTKSFAGAEETAARFPGQAGEIVAAAKTAFLHGDQWAYTAGIVATLVGALVVVLLFPGKDREAELLAGYHEEDRAAAPPVAEVGPVAGRVPGGRAGPEPDGAP